MELPTGFLAEAPLRPDGSKYEGRFQLSDIQTTRDQDGVFITSTVNVRMILDACDADLLWTDQQVQRGVRPGVTPTPPTLLSLKSGLPDPTKYVFDRPRAEEIAEKLLRGDRLFLNPLIWNMRPGQFEVFIDETTDRGDFLYIYSGRVFLPDSHHRHQAIIHAARAYQEAPQEYPEFSLDRQFTIELYFMDADDEGEYFFEKNQLGKTADKSKAFDLTTQDHVALAARRAIELAPSLGGNVNRVTDRLSARNKQVMTLSTLVGIVQTINGSATMAGSEIESVATSFAAFYELLCSSRPELGVLSEADRVAVRRNLMIDQAVILHGFAVLAKKFHQEYSSADEHGRAQVAEEWRAQLAKLDSSHEYVTTAPDGTEWRGDLFDRKNPVWRQQGILQATRTGGETVSNTRQTRATAASILEGALNAEEPHNA